MTSVTIAWLTLANTLGLVVVGIIALLTQGKVRQVSVEINGRLSQLLALTKSSSHAEGVEQGRVAEVKRVEEKQ